jgi:hypothetical protein
MSHCRQDRRRVKAKQALAPTGDALSARKRALPVSLRKGAADGRGLRPSNPGSESPRLLRPPYAWPLSTANRHTTKRYKQLLAAASAGRCRGRSARLSSTPVDDGRPPSIWSAIRRSSIPAANRPVPRRLARRVPVGPGWGPAGTAAAESYASRAQATSTSQARSSPRLRLRSSASARTVRRQRKRPPRETPQGRPFCRFPPPLPVMPFVG